MRRSAYLGLCGAAVLALAAPAAARQSDGAGSNGQAAAPRAPVPLTDLYMAPASYFGQTITIRGKVDDVYSQHLLTVEQDRLFSDGHDVIVIIPKPDAIALDDTVVTVSGTVRPFAAAEMARSYDLHGLANDLLARWESRPVIVATSVKTARGAELVRRNGTLPLSAATSARAGRSTSSTRSGGAADASAPADSQASTGTSGHAGEGEGAIVNVSQVTGASSRQDLVDRPVRIMSAKVQHVAGDRAFWIGQDTSDRVFVVVDATSLDRAVGSARGLKDGDLVAITGTMKQVPASNGTVKMTDWGQIDDGDAKALSSHDVYVWAKSVQWLSHP